MIPAQAAATLALEYNTLIRKLQGNKKGTIKFQYISGLHFVFLFIH